MKLCENCKAQLPEVKLPTRVHKVNARLYAAGMIYWETMSAAMNEIELALEEQGFKLTAWSFNRIKSSSARVHAEVEEGKWLSVSFHRMESGRYEVVAYVS